MKFGGHISITSEQPPGPSASRAKRDSLQAVSITKMKGDDPVGTPQNIKDRPKPQQQQRPTASSSSSSGILVKEEPPEQFEEEEDEMSPLSLQYMEGEGDYEGDGPDGGDGGSRATGRGDGSGGGTGSGGAISSVDGMYEVPMDEHGENCP